MRSYFGFKPCTVTCIRNVGPQFTEKNRKGLLTGTSCIHCACSVGRSRVARARVIMHVMATIRL